MKLIPTRYAVTLDELSALRDTSIEFRGKGKWAIYDTGRVLNKNGMWEYEPSPSSRDDKFISRTRFKSPKEALGFLKKHSEKYNES